MQATTIHYPVATAGIWADSIPHQRPLSVVNDYSKAENKKGLPEGHSQLHRLISVPLLEGDKVRMVIGIGNADFDYDDEAVKTAQLFGGELYSMIQRIRSRHALERSEHFLKEAQTLAHLGSWEAGIWTLPASRSPGATNLLEYMAWIPRCLRPLTRSRGNYFWNRVGKSWNLQ